jgi:hypothetical protein
MACEAIEKKLADLQLAEADQKALINGGLVGHALEAAKARLAEIQGEVAAAKDELAKCRAGTVPVTTSANTVGYVGTVEVETDATPRLWLSLTASPSGGDWVKIGSVRAWFTMDLSSSQRPYYLAMLPLLLEAMRSGDQVQVKHGGVAGFHKQDPNDSFEATGVRILRAPIKF